MSIEHQPPVEKGKEVTDQPLQLYLLNGQEVQLTKEQASVRGAQKIGHSGDLGLEAPAEGAIPITHDMHAHPDDMPQSPIFNPKDKKQARKLQRSRGVSFGRRTIAGLTGVAVLGGGVFTGVKMLSGSENDQPTDRKQETPGLVHGPDGEPLQYVEYSNEHSDRDDNGIDDKSADQNQNDIIDSDELWDQENEEFVTPEEAGQLDDVLENATPEDLANIAEIESAIPDFSSLAGVNWKADFVTLDPVVKNRVMFALQHPEEYPGDGLLTAEEAWQADVAYQFTRTPEDILD